MTPVQAMYHQVWVGISSGIIGDLLIAITAIISIELIVLGYIIISKFLIIHARPTMWITPYGTHNESNDEDDFQKHYDNESDRKFMIDRQYEKFRNGG